MAKTLTVTMTDRRPLTIDKDKWPVLASVKIHVGPDPDYGPPHGDFWALTLRKCVRNGGQWHLLAYGSKESWDSGDCVAGHRQGLLLRWTEDWRAVEKLVGELCDLLQVPSHRRSELFAKLPAEEAA